MKYDNQYKDVTVILNSLKSFINSLNSTHVIVKRIHWLNNFTTIIEWLQRII